MTVMDSFFGDAAAFRCSLGPLIGDLTELALLLLFSVYLDSDCPQFDEISWKSVSEDETEFR